MPSNVTVHLAQDGTSTGGTPMFQSNPSASTQDVCVSYIDEQITDRLGEFIDATFGEGSATLEQTGVSGSDDDGNYVIYETPSGAITGLYLHRETIAQITGDEPTVDNAPESLAVTLREGDESSFDAVAQADEEEVDALLGESDGSSGESSDTDSDEETVEVSEEEEIGLVEE